MTELVAPFVPVHGSWTFLPDMNCLLDPSVIDRESDRSTRWIKEAVHTRKEGPRSMNRDEGSYQLSNTYDRFLGSTLNLSRQEPEEEDLVPASSDEGL